MHGADEKTFSDFLNSFREQTAEQGEVLLGMDKHGAQKTPLCQLFMSLFHIQPLCTPSRCTIAKQAKRTSVVTNHGSTLKRMMAAAWV